MTSFVFTGTATDHNDLLSKIVAHLTSGTMGSQAWSVLSTVTDSTGTYKYMHGPGLSGTDNIYVNIRAFSDIPNNIYNWQIRGAINYNSLLSYSLQPGTSSAANIPLWDSSIPYWLIANGRRFILISKISTVYSSCYAGFILPYGTSAEMPYPLFIGGSINGANRWSQTNYLSGAFWDAPDNVAFMRHFDGAWLSVANYVARSDGVRQEQTNNAVWPFEYDISLGENQDGTYGLLPAIVHSTYSGGNVYGELEGVFQVSGFSNAAEDILDIGADSYLVVQSMYRSGRRDYAAIKLG